MMEHAGELAALATAACWAVGATFFELAGRRVGSRPVNLFRLVLALGLLTLYGLVARGRPLPLDASGHAWGWLALSGVVGLVLGDLCLFRAYILLGSRLATLIMSTTPLITALFGYVVLGERLSALDLVGMGMVVAGIAIALRARHPAGKVASTAGAAGILLALGGALGQAVGLVLSKYGMRDYDPFAATQIRVIVALAGMLVLASAAGWWPQMLAAARDRRAVSWISLGAAFGPFLGVGLSLLAVQRTAAGIAASLMATTPILIIPIAVRVHRERVGAGSVVGTAIAVAGAVLLFLS